MTVLNRSFVMTSMIDLYEPLLSFIVTLFPKIRPLTITDKINETAILVINFHEQIRYNAL